MRISFCVLLNFCRHAVTFSAKPITAWVSAFRAKKSSRNETLQILRASAQKFSRHGSETPRAMPCIESGGVAAAVVFWEGCATFPTRLCILKTHVDIIFDYYYNDVVQDNSMINRTCISPLQELKIKFFCT